MTFLQTLQSIPGLTDYYPLDKDAKDVVGGLDGTNHGVTFNNGRAVFNGSVSIELPDHNDFSVATKGGLTIVAFLAITDWKGKGASEYIHWMGKGKAGAHEWTFRHYVKGGSGEAASRQGRTSFYHYNPAGGLGAGSYYEDSSFPTSERVFTATCDLKNVSLSVNGAVRDTDALSGYSIKPSNTASRVFLGTRGDNTGFLVGTLRRVAFYNRVLSTTEVKKIYDLRDQTESSAPAQPTPTVPTTPIEEPTSGSYLANADNLLSQYNLLAAALRKKGIV